MNNTKGLSPVALMVVIGVVSLLLRIAAQEMLKIEVEQNESGAQATLKLISAALENYAKDNKGVFPEQMSVLAKGSPVYIDKDYISESPWKGYIYSCLRLEASGYSCSAAPLKCKISARSTYTITTGGSLAVEDCTKRD